MTRAADDLLALAETAATRAGDLLRNAARSRTVSGSRLAEHKSSATDLVTDADRSSEELIVATLLDARPDDAIIGEEGGTRPGTSGVTWIIDPLDGTTNFVYGYGSFAVSIAAERDGVTEIGVVLDPVRDDFFRAERGRGAYLGNRRLAVKADPPPLGESLIATGFSYAAPRRLEQARLLPTLLPAVRDIRRGGAAALDLCFLAAGRVDAYYEADLKPWDVAAGLLIALEAGAAHRFCEDLVASSTLVVAHPARIGELETLLRAASRD